MNKTIYIRQDDIPIWDRAKELAGEKLAPVIIENLKRYISEKEAQAKGFERIEIRFKDFDENDFPKAKAFIGRWIFSKERPYNITEDEQGFSGRSYALAVTPKDKVVVFSWHFDPDSRWSYRFQLFESLEEAVRDANAHYVAIAAVEQIGVLVEELDI